MITDQNYAIALCTVRVVAGIHFFFQGYDKVFKVGMREIQRTMEMGLGNAKIPKPLITIVVFFTSWAELICGFLLILGLFKYYALSLLCIDILVVVFGFSLSNPMWENNHVFIRLMLVVFLLLVPVAWDYYSLDYLITIFAMSK